MCLCIRKKFIFMYFLNYYKPCTIDSAKNHALLKNLPFLYIASYNWKNYFFLFKKINKSKGTKASNEIMLIYFLKKSQPYNYMVRLHAE